MSLSTAFAIILITLGKRKIRSINNQKIITNISEITIIHFLRIIINILTQTQFGINRQLIASLVSYHAQGNVVQLVDLVQQLVSVQPGVDLELKGLCYIC